MNKSIITGTIYGDMTTKDIGKDNIKLLLTIITRNNYATKEGVFESTFISCVAWNDTASFILRNFKRGDPIEVVGSIINESWEKDGVKHYKDRVRIREVSFVPRPYVTPETEDVGTTEDLSNTFNDEPNSYVEDDMSGIFYSE